MLRLVQVQLVVALGKEEDVRQPVKAEIRIPNIQTLMLQMEMDLITVNRNLQVCLLNVSSFTISVQTLGRTRRLR